MSRARGNLEIEDVRLGKGPRATREHEALIACRISLHRGECVRGLTRLWIDLKRRETIAGLRYGVEGMRAGGVRRVTIPPHLAYGESAVPAAHIPPRALLICDVELLKLRPTRPTPQRVEPAIHRD
ncbi:MAG TPA: FKBP-type peptidyl-prolyl cis-trans isomerase [Phycisphaerales bacterium]|nr:FKBP-type peptidyl-prolyl cis-trans isomerase [Phycisphaerales bacterium]